MAGPVALIIEGQVHAKGGLSPGAYVLAVAATAPLAWRTRAPLVALVGVEAGALLCVVAFHASWAATGIVIVGLYTVALLGDRQRSLVVGALTAIGVITAIVLVDGSLDLGGVAIRVPLVFASLALGDTVRSRQALRAAARGETCRCRGVTSGCAYPAGSRPIILEYRYSDLSRPRIAVKRAGDEELEVLVLMVALVVPRLCAWGRWTNRSTEAEPGCAEERAPGSRLVTAGAHGGSSS